jgi:glucosamine--fructose-6-phosphate aminotransferase (isomerizing)
VIVSHVETEIREQPEALSRLLAGGRARAEEIAGLIRARAPRYVVIAARGSSDNAARYAQYLFGAHNRLPVSLATPSLYTVYGSGPSLAGGLVIGVSQSGRSPDIVAVLEAGRRDGSPTVAITNDPGSPLAKAADQVLPLAAGVERAVAATKTYSTSLGALAMLSAALEGDAARFQELERVPALVQAAIDANASLQAKVARYRYAEQFVVVGRGFNYSTAFEIALKMKETSYVVAEPYSPADLLHGPVAMIDRGFPALVIAPSGRVLADLQSFVGTLEERHAEIVTISDDAALRARARVGLALPPGVPEWLSPIVAIVPGQLWAVALATTRGLDPDRPRGLSKVTETL